MSLLNDARELERTDLPKDDEGGCWFCGQVTGEDGHRGPCPWLSLPRIIAALEERERMIVSMTRVWGKAQESERADYKQYVELGDILYHATDGERGRCGQYDGAPCRSVTAMRETEA
jgi:hypothetical protein